MSDWPATAVIDEARRALREHVGFGQFRPGEAEAVAAVTGPQRRATCSS